MLYFDTFANTWWQQRGSPADRGFDEESDEDLLAWRRRLEHLREKTLSGIADRQRIIEVVGPAPVDADTWVEEERAEVDGLEELLNEIDAEIRTVEFYVRQRGDGS